MCSPPADLVTGTVDWDCVPLRAGKVCAHLRKEQVCVHFVCSELWARVGMDLRREDLCAEERTSPWGSSGSSAMLLTSSFLEILCSGKASFQVTPRAHISRCLPPLPRITECEWGGEWGLTPAGVCQAKHVPCSGLCCQEEGVFLWFTGRCWMSSPALHSPPSLLNSLKGTVGGT